MLDLARVALNGGRSVIIDATWRDPRWRRAAARLAESTASDLVEVRCVAPVAVAAARADIRRAKGVDSSEADADVARALAGQDGGWWSASDIYTAGAAGQALRSALALFEGAPVGGDADP